MLIASRMSTHLDGDLLVLTVREGGEALQGLNLGVLPDANIVRGDTTLRRDTGSLCRSRSVDCRESLH